MAIVYFDSSAFVKLLVEEDGSELAATLWDGGDAVVSSRLAYPEVRAALTAAARAHRLGPADLRRAEVMWEDYWAATRAVELTASVTARAGQLAGAHALRGADAVHLASLLAVGVGDCLFAVWDERLRTVHGQPACRWHCTREPGGAARRPQLIGGIRSSATSHHPSQTSSPRTSRAHVPRLLTNFVVKRTLGAMHDVAVIDDPAAAEVSLDPVRSRLLAAMIEPGSATALAARLDLPRQKVNYHLRLLEQHGLVELVEERRRGNFTERVMRSTAATYVISPEALSDVQPDPARSPDQVSAAWLLALAARLVRDVGALVTGARRTGTRVATHAVDGEVRFASAADRAAFTRELGSAVTDLVARYHSPDADGARSHRLVVAVHPHVPTT